MGLAQANQDKETTSSGKIPLSDNLKQKIMAVSLILLVVIGILIYSHVKNNVSTVYLAEYGDATTSIPAPELADGTVYIQQILCLKNNTGAVGLQFATYSDRDNLGEVTVSIRGELGAYGEKEFDVSQMSDNTYQFVPLSRQAQAGEMLEITVSGTSPAGRAVTIWSVECSKSVELDAVFSVNGVSQPTQLSIAFQYIKAAPTALLAICGVLLLYILLVIVGSVQSKRPAWIISWSHSGDKLVDTEWLYIAGCFIICFIWAVTFTSMNYGPDEYMRYDIPKFIFENGVLPYGWEESLRNPIWGFSYGFNMSITYIISAFFMWLTSAFTTDATALLVAARFTSILSGVGVAYYSIKISKHIIKSPIRWAFVVLMTIVPQMVFLSSYVNRDSFSLFTATLIVYAWIRGIEAEWDAQSCVRLAIGIGLCFLSYEFAYGYILCSFLIYCVWYLCHRKETTFKRFISSGLLILGIVFLICGWVYIRNSIIYDGDFMGLRITAEYGEKYAQEAFRPSMRNTFRQRGFSMLGMLGASDWISSSFKSFFSTLGYMNLYAGPLTYLLYASLTLVGIVTAGCVIIFWIKMQCGKSHLLFLSNKTDNAMLFGLIALSGVITVCLSVFHSWSEGYSPQGRYFICAAPCIYLAIAIGLDQVTHFLSKVSRVKVVWWQRVVTLGVCIIVCLTMLEGYISCLRAYVHLN